jgi:nucleoside-diphosphate-sugar epimerase
VSEISLAREVLDFEPGVSFEQGLARTVEWFSKRTG